MANDEHIAILKKGVAAWNAWRHENPDISPDLSGAYLFRGWELGSARHLRRSYCRSQIQYNPSRPLQPI